MAIMPSSKPYPEPLTISPLGQQHTNTLILLHGRGSNSTRFGQMFLESTGIATRLPSTKFVFPTARKRRSMVLKRIPINQWSDNYSLEDPNERTELQLEGLEESSAFLRGLVDEEAAVLSSSADNDDDDGYGRVVIGGLSQGCAAAVFCLLGGFPSSGGSKRLGGLVGMSGWLPFEKEIAGLLKIDQGNAGGPESGTEAEEEDHDDGGAFARDTDEENNDVPLPIQAVNHVRDILNIRPVPSPDGDNNDHQDALHLKTPVFLGHGSADPKVSVDLGLRMVDILSGENGLRMDVTWKAYKEFGHWYKVPDEIDDVVEFLEQKVGVPVAEPEACGMAHGCSVAQKIH